MTALEDATDAALAAERAGKPVTGQGRIDAVDALIALAQTQIDERMLALRLQVSVALGAQIPTDPPPEPPPVAGQIFPADSVWNTKIDKAPLHPRSADLMANWMHAGHGLHPDFGTIYAGAPNGMPINIVGNSTPRRKVTFHTPNYESESDPMPADGLPIPDDVKIEGKPIDGSPMNPASDHHMLLLDTDRNELHELYSIRIEADGSYSTGAYAFWNLSSNALRPNGWTSADVAGLPISPLLVRYDEAAAGLIPHAIRFCLDLSWGQTWPARHPGTSGGQEHPPMGTRVRLKAEVPTEGHYPIYDSIGNITGMYDAVISPINSAILKCMKDYGLILADHAGDWFFEGEPDSRWDDDDLHLLQLIPGVLFEVIDGDALKIDSNSMQAKQL